MKAKISWEEGSRGMEKKASFKSKTEKCVDDEGTWDSRGVEG